METPKSQIDTIDVSQIKKTSKKEDDEESVGSLKDFIVHDSADEDIDMTDDESEHSDTTSSDEDSNDSEDSDVKPIVPKPKRVKEDPEIIKLLAEEAEAFTKSIQGTVVGGRTLRSREPEKLEARKPKDMYYERFGRKEEIKALEKFTKKDIIEWVRKLAAQHKADYEAAGNAWPTLHIRMSLEAIRAEYDRIKKFLDLPDSDADSSDDEMDIDDDEDDDIDESDDDESEEI